MSWRTVVIKNHCKLSYKNNHLIYKTVKDTQLIHLSEIGILLLETTDISLTTMLISKLVEENILVIFCDAKRLPIAKILPYYGRNDSTLQIKKQVGWTDERKKLAWKELLYQKLQNQASYLKDQNYTEQARGINTLLSTLEIDDPSNREGHAARITFSTLFGTTFNREQDNDINAGLNYGYTILLSLFAREITRCGCLTQLGVGHINQFNDFNFASDLMEPFRVLVDEIIYENKDKEFPVMKREIFKMFDKTYHYDKSQMYLFNIARKYVRQVVDYLNEETDEMPIFER